MHTRPNSVVKINQKLGLAESDLTFACCTKNTANLIAVTSANALAQFKKTIQEFYIFLNFIKKEDTIYFHSPRSNFVEKSNSI